MRPSRLDVRRPRIACPLLIFHGIRDTTIPYGNSVAFVERAAYPDTELRLLKDGDHRLTAYRDEIVAAACDFFARCRGRSRPEDLTGHHDSPDRH